MRTVMNEIELLYSRSESSEILSGCCCCSAPFHFSALKLGPNTIRDVCRDERGRLPLGSQHRVGVIEETEEGLVARVDECRLDRDRVYTME